ncbi:MAG: MMPL family transporter, partial [Thermoplasmata archaeon]|nr:MMPL family transporter [Thermoplasmata archaeon]
EGVVGSQSVAVVINELCHYVIDADGLGFSYTYDENTTILNTRLDWVQGRINLLKSIMNGEIDPGQFGQGDVVIEPDAVKFSFGLLMSSDFDLENFTASRTLILIEMDGNYSRSELRDIVGQVKDSIAALDLHYITEQETSEYYIAHEMESTIQPTMVMLGIGIVAIITVILVGSFRHFSYVWAPLLTLVIAIAWTFATMTAFGFVLSILDVAVIPLIVGLGVDYVVHISRRYQEGLFGGMNTSESIGNSIRKVGAALFLAFVTTIVAFLSNVVSEVPPIRQFGFMCALGITYAYVLAITFYPSIRLVVDKKRGGEAAAPKPTPGIDGVMKRIADLVEERPRPIMGVLLVLVVGSLFAATMVPVEFNVEAFLPEDWESISTNRDIRENFDVGSYSAVYVLVEGEDLANPAFLDSMFNITEKMEDDSLVVKVVDKATGNETYFIDNIATMVSKAVEDNRSLAVAYELTDSGRPVFGSCTPQDIRGLFDHISENEDIYDSLKGLSYVEAFPKLMYYD